MENGTNDTVITQSYIKSTPTSFRYDIYLDTSIGEPSGYRELLDILKGSGNSDEIHLYINTFGGHLQTTIALVHAMSQCQGTTFTYIEGHAYSAGGVLFLAGDVPILSEFSDLMIHAPIGGEYGKHSDVISSLDHNKRMIRDFYLSCYENFLSEEEINSVIAGTDIYLNYDEIVERLTHRQECNEKAAQELLEEIKEVEKEFSKEELLKKSHAELVSMILGEKE